MLALAEVCALWVVLLFVDRCCSFIVSLSELLAASVRHVMSLFLGTVLTLVNTDCCHLVTAANSAFHPYGVDKSSTNLPGLDEGGVVTSVGWQITLCDPTDKWRPIVLR